jgi:hypothetical protein
MIHGKTTVSGGKLCRNLEKQIPAQERDILLCSLSRKHQAFWTKSLSKISLKPFPKACQADALLV